ncbi:MAG: hypothetical protein ACTTJH_06705 [Bacteroidales bacterium]
MLEKILTLPLLDDTLMLRPKSHVLPVGTFRISHEECHLAL